MGLSLPLLQLHETLRNRALINLYLKPEAPLHVGKGGVEFLREVVQFDTDREVIPIIPSEGIKGFLRALSNSLAKHKYVSFQDPEVEDARRSHRGKDGHKVEGEKLRELEEKAESLKAIFDNSQWKEIRDKKIEMYLSIHCPICKLFGSRYLAGKLLFYDAIPSSEVRLSTYTGVAVNRKTRMAEKRRLFKTQYVTPTDDLSFKTRIIADNITGTPEAMLLALLLEYIMNEGLRLGGQKSRGYGLMVLERPTEVKYVEFNTKPASYEQKLENLKKILFDEKHCKSLTMEEYISILRSK